MPKVKKSQNILVQNWIDAITDNSFENDNGSVKCKACEKEICCDRKSQLIQHLNTVSHRSKIAKQPEVSQEENIVTKKNEFYIDMCKAMVAVNMSWRSLDNKIWRSFLMKYMNQNIPDESTLRKNYLNNCNKLAMHNIKSDIGENYMWISVDETTDKLGRYVANLIVGKMCDSAISIPHLLSSKQLEVTNYASIARFVNSAIRMAWPDGVEERILLLVTDSAAYMIKAAKQLKVFYPNLIHITCAVHRLNRVAEEIRVLFPSVDNLISSVKKVFRKAPLRVQCYRRKLPNIPLPPEPVITRWGTWLEAVEFYAKYLDNIKEVIQSFDADDAASIKLAQNVLQEEEIIQHLVFIKTYFGTLPINMKKLETSGMPLTDSMKLLNDVEQNLKGVPGGTGEKMISKWNAVLKRNPGYKELSKISKSLEGEIVEEPIEIECRYWSKFKYAPITSCDVERSFSAYKLILSDKHSQLSADNIEKMLVVYCNSNYNQ